MDEDFDDTLLLDGLSGMQTLLDGNADIANGSTIGGSNGLLGGPRHSLSSAADTAAPADPAGCSEPALPEPDWGADKCAVRGQSLRVCLHATRSGALQHRLSRSCAECMFECISVVSLWSEKVHMLFNALDISIMLCRTC